MVYKIRFIIKRKKIKIMDYAVLISSRQKLMTISRGILFIDFLSSLIYIVSILKNYLPKK